MQDFTELYNFKNQLLEDNLDINCQILINFFKTRRVYNLDQLIALTDPELVDSMRSHALTLSINKTEYLKLLRRDPAKYHKFLSDVNIIATNIMQVQQDLPE